MCEYESEDCGDGFREGFWWSFVAGVQDSPGLDVGDDSFDLVADLVDGGVVGLVIWVEGKFCGFFGVVMPSPVYPLSPIWRGVVSRWGRSVTGTSSRPQRRRAWVS